MAEAQAAWLRAETHSLETRMLIAAPIRATSVKRAYGPGRRGRGRRGRGVLIRWHLARSVVLARQRPHGHAYQLPADLGPVISWRRQSCARRPRLRPGGAGPEQQLLSVPASSGSGALLAVCFDEAFDKLVDIARLG
jgi:hypothetical protein